MDAEIVKMSSKGQLVVPQDIREDAGFKPSDRFVPFQVKDGVLFKKLKMPDLKVEFNSLAKEIQQQFGARKVTPDDVKEAVKWARKR
ncbi:MAG: AbrB/MazE/SpoVT family DNA-binding domain-containing protein [Nanoarchaeota archaeon]|nr:AbrB/MazE/SpoVT family DNA-binding domain-containing protein [Nanoarchaeota archaeon]MBU1005686.1 AbrB/MazE/SpoVT family DNA-binding domain-containing protein [Nanoarchaeota archaeon]MBU1946177.1 AbrB/MazE/SpoVT family DNA-binding domain-containing protein [Nanoarchaeota archaeon]